MKEKDLDKDTIVAYHAYLQNRIHNELNALGMGPGWLPCRGAQLFGLFSVLSTVTGILVIALRHRHVYLVDWWHAFLGPFFIILGLILACLSTYLIIIAKRRSNQYRRELFFRPIGDYGVAVVHKSTLMHEQEHKSDLKSGTNPHRTVMPHSEAFSSHTKEKERRHRGHENRGYMDHSHEERRGGRHHDDRHRDDRRRRDDRDRDDRRRRDDRDRDDRRRRDDREDRPRRPDDDRRRRPDDRRDRDRDDHRRREDRERRDPEKRRPPPDEDRRDMEKRRPPPDEDHRDMEKRRPDDHERPSAPTQGGRRAVRGIPKLPDSSQTMVQLDENFGKAATDESEL